VVKVTGLASYPSPAFFYAITNHSSTVSPQLDATNWAGYGNAANATIRAKWIWTPSYNLNTSIVPRVKSVKMGDGYEQRMQDGINTVLLSITMSYENRTLRENLAMSHFLNERGGFETFLFTPQPPYNKEKLFLARQWDGVYNFFDNYSLSVTFEELPIIA
jgi:phage-related protein